MIRTFNRYELKYVISTEIRDKLLAALTDHMGPDTEGSPTGSYEVNSLYHDTWDLACYRSKIDGINFRRKLRIRRYGALEDGAVDPPVMVEIKQRINRTTQKRRLALPLHQAYILCEGQLEPRFEHPTDQRTAEEILYLVGTLQLNPTCLIRYRRRAFVGSVYEAGLRITFDEDLRVASPSHGLGPGAPTHFFLPRDRVILEVKSNDVVPLWVSRLFAAHAVKIARYSKYCAGLAHLRRLTPGADLPQPGAQHG